MEISPSGQGLKIWARGSLPANLPGVKVGDGAIELYGHSRYFTVTGRAFSRCAPLQVEGHNADLLGLYGQLTTCKRRPPSSLRCQAVGYGTVISTIPLLASVELFAHVACAKKPSNRVFKS